MAKAKSIPPAPVPKFTPTAEMFPISVSDGLLWARLGIDRELRLRARAAPGSYGIVFLAGSERTGDVAVKGIGVLHARNVDAVHRALCDAVDRARRVGDPAVLVPFECGRTESAVYYIEPWVPGGSVADLLRARKPVPLARVVQILRAVAPALDKAHEKGLVHGGIRPGNLLLGPEGRVLLADFALGAALAPLPVALNADAARGQAYTAPEQWRHGVVDGRADQYSLALIAYELLTAHTRFDAHGVEGVPTLEPLEINDLAQLRPDIPLYVNSALRMALGAKPANRFPTVGAFVDAMEGKRHGQVQGLPLVRFRIGDIKPRHVLFTLSGLATLFAIAAVGDAATNGALRSEARQLWDRYAPDGPKFSVSAPAEPTSLQRPVGGGGGGGGSGGGGPSNGGSLANGGRPSSGGLAPSYGAFQNSQARTPDFGPEVTGGSAGTTTRRSTSTSTTQGRESGKRLGDMRVIAPPETPKPQKNASDGSSSDLLPSLYARAKQSVTRYFDRKAADSAAAAAAAASSDGFVSVDADGGAAVVTVDGVPMGTAPTTLRLSPGRHTVAVHGARAYTPSEVVVTVTKGTTTGASFRVKK